MRPKINIITLMVADLKKSLEFYRDGLGLPTLGIVSGYEDHVLFEMENGLSLVLFQSDDYDQDYSGLVLSHAAASKEEVISILNLAQKAGGKITNEPTQELWGYYGSFTDPDGHEWEIMWNPQFELN